MRPFPSLLVVPAAVAIAALQTQAPTALKVEFNKENVVASRLEGRWVPHAELGARLGSHTKPNESIVFRSEKEPAFFSKLPAAAAKSLAKSGPIYLAGTLQWVGWDGLEHPFVLVSHIGNPHVVLFRARGGDPLGDAESCNLSLIPALDPKNDLLFVGGDFNNEPFRSYQRAPETAK
ncbi:MAG TPA: hypothetical protein VKE69_12645 [Planctomycetota bacterium]|nr:hypothetical protein [Planctomycetota bacterium]